MCGRRTRSGAGLRPAYFELLAFSYFPAQNGLKPLPVVAAQNRRSQFSPSYRAVTGGSGWNLEFCAGKQLTGKLGIEYTAPGFGVGFAEFGVVANVILGLINIGRQHQQHGVGGVTILRGPNHGRQMDADAGRIEHDFLTLPAVVGDDVAFAVGAHQELMARAMGMFPAHFPRRHVEYQEKPLDFERQIFGGGEKSAQVGNQGQPVDGDAFDAGRMDAFLRRDGSGLAGLRTRRANISGNAGRVSR